MRLGKRLPVKEQLLRSRSALGRPEPSQKGSVPFRPGLLARFRLFTLEKSENELDGGMLANRLDCIERESV